MIRDLITPGQSLRRVMSREIAPTYMLLGEDYFFQDLIINAINDVFLAGEGEIINLVMGVDREDDIINNLNMNSLFSQKSVIVVKNSKKINSKYFEEIIDYFSSPISDKVLILIYQDPYVSNKFVKSISKHATCIDIRTPFKNKMKEWVIYYVKKNNINLPNHLLNQLIEDYGENTYNVVNEINKLNIFSNGNIEKIINSNLHKKENQIWKLVDAYRN